MEVDNTVIGLAILALIIVIAVLLIYIYIQPKEQSQQLSATIVPNCASDNSCIAAPSCPVEFANTNGSTYNVDYFFIFNKSIAQCYLNSSINICPPTAAYTNEANCKSETKTCAEGYYQNSTAICVPYPSCPVGYGFDSNVSGCLLNNACPSGYTFNIGSGNPICTKS